MRKFERDEISNLLQTLLKATQIMATNKNLQQVKILATDCYDTIVSINEFIREKLSQERYAEYCNLMSKVITFYEKSTILRQINGVYTSEAKNIIGQLKTISKMILEEDIQYIITFMPYKSSMWDSMESVWEAAKQDSRCICHIVPIPYYEKDKSGETSTLKYEGNDYPSYVPVIDWQKYELGEIFPDVIYIHNPYDEANYVTTVPEQFYSYNLKPYTDALVYIPYFVMNPIYSKNMFEVSALHYVDYIIAQTEETLKGYQQFTSEDIWEKVLPLGSPKVDRLIHNNLKKEDIRADWKEKIGNKKVVLYNTSLSALLKQRGYYTKKLRSVFEYFQTREDCILLWRPHPLMESTLKSMASDLLQEYIENREFFLKEEIGIYDDSADFLEAFVASDLYYGDPSSLAYLYEVTGKDVIMQNCQFLRQKDVIERKAPIVQSGVVYQDTIYFPASNTNALLKMNVKSRKVEWVGKFPYDDDKVMMFSQCFLFQDTIIFIPLFARGIYSYDIITGKFELQIDRREEKAHWAKAVRCDDELVLVPALSGKICKYSYEKGEIVDTNIELNDIKGLQFHKFALPYTDARMFHKRLWITCGFKKWLYEVDLTTETIIKHQLNISGGKGLSRVVSLGDKLWIVVNRPGIVISYNPENQEIREYTTFTNDTEEFNLLENPIKDVVVVGKSIWFLPNLGNTIAIVDEDGRLKRTVELSKEENEVSAYRKHSFTKFCFGCETSEGLFVLPSGSKQSILLDYEGNVKENILTIVEDERFLEKQAINPINYLGEFGDIFSNRYYEGYFWSLDEGLEKTFVTTEYDEQRKMEFVKRLVANVEGTCGKNIHDTIMRKL